MGAKADCLTQKEISDLKKTILKEIRDNGIKVYTLPDCDSDEDEDFKKQVQQLRDSMPFAVVGANAMVEIKGKKLRGRQYPWGIVEVENPTHCDFVKLRTMLISHMQDLQEVTHDLHYENFRAQVLSNSSNLNGSGMMGQSTSSIGRYADSESLEAKELEIQKMREMMEHMQRQLVMQ